MSTRSSLLAAALVLGLAILAWLALGGGRANAPAPVSTPAASASGSGSPSPSGPSPLQELRFNELLQGVLLLQKGPFPVTDEQAVALGNVIQGLHPDQNAGCYVRLQVTEALTEAQKQVLDARFDALRAQPGFIYRSPEGEPRRAYTELLVKEAGEPRPAALVVPPDYRCVDVDGAKPTPYADLLVEFHDDLEEDPALSLTPEQIRRLVPCFLVYQDLVYTEESLILDILTAEQESYLGYNLRLLSPNPSQQKRYERGVLELAGARK